MTLTDISWRIGLEKLGSITHDHASKACADATNATTNKRKRKGKSTES